jgi:hypothetical protein
MVCWWVTPFRICYAICPIGYARRDDFLGCSTVRPGGQTIVRTSDEFFVLSFDVSVLCLILAFVFFMARQSWSRTMLLFFSGAEKLSVVSRLGDDAAGAFGNIHAHRCV